jgi:protein phosphatase
MDAAYIVCLSDKNKRDDNEDSYLVVEFTPHGARTPLLVLGVADGMGGYEHGAEVSREVLRQMCLSLFQSLAVECALNGVPGGVAFGPVHLAAALQEAAVIADGHIRRLVEANGWGMAGATVVVAAIYEGDVVAFNLGDSPLFHYEWASHSLCQLTEDHTYAQALVRGGVLAPHMGRYHEGSSQLEFYVGGGAFPLQPPVRYRKLEAGDLLLLCTDGVNRLLGPAKINALLRRMEGVVESSNGLANMAETIVEAARDAGEIDNQTLVLWRHVLPAAKGG